MDKSILKNFAIYSRNKLIQEIKNKASLTGITEGGMKPPLPKSEGDMLMFDIGATEPYKIKDKEVRQYYRLIDEFNRRKENGDYAIVYKGMMEEVAYTWFNRLIAIRFMEINGYMPDKMRVLSSEKPGVNEPEFVTHYTDTSLEFSDEELDDLYSWKMDGSSKSMDMMFRLLFIKECNALNKNLPELFEKTDDYAELLLTISYNDVDGVLFKLVHDIPEVYFDIEKGKGQVEIIGWLYQYYNTERKDEVFSRPKTKKIEKLDIPAATQLFTPDWIVRYMVENSLGRLCVERLIASGDDRNEMEIAKSYNWKYYIPEAGQSHDVKKRLQDIRSNRNSLELEAIKFIDPAMGSFHIGVYAFEVFMQLYKSQGYRESQAARLIIEKNLYGLDIDKRAYQLSYFACMMKGRQYDSKILNSELKCNLHPIYESNKINSKQLNYFYNETVDENNNESAKKNIEGILELFIDAKEYGSILEMPDKYNFTALIKYLEGCNFNSDIPTEIIGIEETQKEILQVLNIAKVLSQNYDIVSTNPPYMGSSGMNPKLSKYLGDNYPDSKADLFAVFMERCRNFTKSMGYYAMITQHAWMFLTSFEKLRTKLRDNNIQNMIHLGPRAFEEIGGEVVQSTSFIFLNNYISGYKSSFIRLTDFNNAVEKEVKTLEAINNPDCGYYYETMQDDFENIPGMPIAYWANPYLLAAFDTGKPMHSIVAPRQGLATADNNKFLRLWHEINIMKSYFDSKSIEDTVNSKAKWFPYNKGGMRRQWFGNYDYLVNWESDGMEIRNFKDDKNRVRSRPQNTAYYFKESITWSLITSGGFSIRYRQTGSIHDVAGMSAFADNQKVLFYILGLMSTKISNYVFKILNPTINLQIGDFNDFPVLFGKSNQVMSIVNNCISISKTDWDSFETSWDFKVHPLLDIGKQNVKPNSIEQAYNTWKDFANSQFVQLKENEEELNRIFIEIYGLEDELTSDISDKDITIAKIFDNKEDIYDDIKGNRYILTKEDIIKSFISYGVGCIFGRYSLDMDGLAYAGGELEERFRFENGKCLININGNWTESSTAIAKDNVVIITDEDYFKDDLTNRFVEFVKVAFGEKDLNKNLRFIADALRGRDTPKEVIRNYFLKDFFNDHKKTYKNRPIYWLYESGKENGFKALIYMHRYNADNTGRLRVDYLHEVQKAYEIAIDNLKYNIAHNNNPREIAKMEKRLSKIIKQLKECKDYDEKVAHIALARIFIDLDDGVKVNYEKAQSDEKGNNMKLFAKL